MNIPGVKRRPEITTDIKLNTAQTNVFKIMLYLVKLYPCKVQPFSQNLVNPLILNSCSFLVQKTLKNHKTTYLRQQIR